MSDDAPMGIPDITIYQLGSGLTVSDNSGWGYIEYLGSYYEVRLTPAFPEVPDDDTLPGGPSFGSTLELFFYYMTALGFQELPFKRGISLDGLKMLILRCMYDSRVEVRPSDAWDFVVSEWKRFHPHFGELDEPDNRTHRFNLRKTFCKAWHEVKIQLPVVAASNPA